MFVILERRYDAGLTLTKAELREFADSLAGCSEWCPGESYHRWTLKDETKLPDVVIDNPDAFCMFWGNGWKSLTTDEREQFRQPRKETP